MKALFVNPKKRIIPLDYGICFPPLGLLSICSSIKGHDVRIADFKVENEKDLPKIIEDSDFVCVTCTTASADKALEICKIAKSYGKKTVVGGVHAALNYKNLIKNEHVDFVLRGDGELGMQELLDGKELSKINGLSYKKGKRAFYNKVKLVKNLDDLPFLDYPMLKVEKYHAWGKRLVSINTSRGCPHKCSFCCTPQQWGGFWRAKSPEKVIEEIKNIPKGTKIIYFADDNFFHDIKRVKEICNLIIEEGLNYYEYGCEARADDIAKDKEIVELMRKAGFKMIVLGVETSSERTIKSMNKQEKVSDVVEAISLLNKVGIFIWGTIIVGYIDETKEDVHNTIKFAKKLPIDAAQFTALTPFPGTPFFNQCENRGLLLDKPFSKYTTINPVIKTANLNKNEIIKLLTKAYWSFYNPLAVSRKLIGYMINRQKRWIIKWYFSVSPSLIKWYLNTVFYLTKKVVL